MKLINLDEQSWICLSPNHFNEKEFNKTIYDEVREKLSQQELEFYGRKILMPRLTAWYGEKEYKYSGTVNKPFPMPDSISRIRNSLKKDFEHLPGFKVPGLLFNSVLCNYYRDGNDSVDWHSDDETMLGPTKENVLIASVTFGASRNFVMRNKKTKQKLSFDLSEGDVLIMGGKTQQTWQHKVPKTSKQVDPRLNLTFRVIK